MNPSTPRRVGVPPKPTAPSTAMDMRALDLMGELLDLGVTPERAAETMTVLAKGRSSFVTELVKADKEWTAQREAAAAELPDFLQPGAPDTPPANRPHSLNLRSRPGMRR